MPGNGGGLRVIRGEEVKALLAGREADVMERVAGAYRLHARGETALPHSNFLRFPERPADRIIALPAFLGAGVQLAGLKWIASVPGNVRRGMERASAVLILNDAATGHARALLEASLVSAARTAASAALAAERLSGLGPDDRVTIGLIGCGRINLEIVRYLAAAFPRLPALELYDLDPQRAEHMAERLPGALGAPLADVAIRVQPTLEAVLAAGPLTSFATTAGEPHVHSLAACPAGATLLHISLRDLAVPCVLACDNVVDDADHVCRAATSLHLAEQQVGNRAFIRCGLGDVLDGKALARPDPARITAFSPFGLGILDLAVGQLVLERAEAEGLGVEVPDFLPQSMVW